MSRAGWALLVVLVALAGCAISTPERPPMPPPSTAVLQELGYRDVVQYGQEYAEGQGYELLEVREVYPVAPNWWRVRFAVAPEGSGRLLELEFDGSRRQVIKSTEVDGVSGRVVPRMRGPLP